MNNILVDRYGRKHDYLRISLTDNCNLRCFYCMPEEDYIFTPTKSLMQPKEIEEIVKIFVENGVKKLRLTGGEPLIRKDIPEILEILARFPVELHMTSNGIRIDELLPQILAANFSSINISLDTLDRKKFIQITRRDYFDRVRKNIDLLLEAGLTVKINVVVMKGLNDDEIVDFVELTRTNNIEVRFIEFMPFSNNRWTSNQVITYKEIITRLSKVYNLNTIQRKKHDTSKLFSISEYQGRFGIISTMTAPFCSDCNRIRLTADGKLKNCLFSKDETNLLDSLRANKLILPLIQQNIDSKAEGLGGQLNKDFEKIESKAIKNRSMISIGG
ncbi:GTP 3',8-cyclase MoaA [Sphingobacterium shayense]|uniref:GTP 3',8-cyclase MoaA n=1 Tax=Sphingobacterium shayense TaxID=626343 RepID=UPI001C130660|nr:GTP 3',8-cyclase MoaA [Sphingobacterium shayense]